MNDRDIIHLVPVRVASSGFELSVYQRTYTQCFCNVSAGVRLHRDVPDGCQFVDVLQCDLWLSSDRSDPLLICHMLNQNQKKAFSSESSLTSCCVRVRNANYANCANQLLQSHDESHDSWLTSFSSLLFSSLHHLPHFLPPSRCSSVSSDPSWRNQVALLAVCCVLVNFLPSNHLDN